MALSDLIDQIEESGDARSLLRPHRGEVGLCDAYFSRLLSLYAADPARAARLAGQWRAFLDLGDDPALAYRAKGAADRMGGRWLASADAFVRAGALAGDDVARLAYSLGAIDGLAKAGRIREAVEMGDRLAAGLDGLGEPALAARARLNTANALLWADQGEAARAYLERAIPIFKAEKMAVEEASARLSLSSSHLYGGDPAVAAREATAAAALAGRLGLEFIGTLCWFNLASVALVQGRVDEAFSELVSLRPLLAGSPPDAARLELAIGDACLRLNLFAEAEEAYAAVLANRETLYAVDRAYVLFGLAEAKAGSDPVAADALYAQAGHRWRAMGNRAWQAAALAARVALRPGARSALRLARKAVESAEGSPYHETLAHLALAEASSAHHRDPKESLDRAAERVRRYGYRRFAWRIHALRARAAESPLPHYRRMVAEILRERLTVTSIAARAGFLKDKSQALGAYLELLLKSPTPRHVEEVVETIRQTRAATLLDEILRSGSTQILPEQERRLEALREEVANDVAGSSYPDSRSSKGNNPRKRGWTEATHDLGALNAVVPPKVVDGCVVFVETGGGIWAVVGEKSTRLPFGTAELEEALRWLKYELQAVTADRDAPSKEALGLLRELHQGLVAPWLPLTGGRPVRLCPDGLLWKVPWDAVIGGSFTTTLLLHPSLAGGTTVEALDQVAIWIDAANDLPHSVAEELAVLTRFPHAMVMRTRKEIMASLSRSWDHIHVIGHASHNASNPMFSALEFPDGPLYASDIARSDLRVCLACLSACETGALSLEAREEPDGLVRAFLARGAQAVLASIWPLDDAAASRFFAGLYNEFAPDIDLGTAVYNARHNVRSWRDHPYFWASLSLFGRISAMKKFIIASLAVLVPVFASADWRMIVRLKPGQSLADAQTCAASLGGTVADSTPNAPFALFALPSDPLTYAVAQYAIAAGIVDVLWTGDDVTLWSAESVSRGGQLSVISRGGQLSVIGDRSELVAKNDLFLTQVDWNADLANSDGRTVKLAILDNGLSRVQTELWSKVVASYDVFGGNADDKPMGRDSNGDGVLDGGVGHGTMVAGLVDTIAPKVQLVIAKVADSDGKASAWGIVKGLAFAVAQGAEIANISLGAEDPVPAYSAMAEWCQTKGLLVVAASGNADEDHAWYPSKDAFSLCVAGLNPDDTKAWFSNYDAKATASAPAVGLVSQWWDGGLASWSGTSFASPFVSAALADCLRRTTPKSGATLIGAVASSGRNVDAANGPDYQGKIGTVLDIMRLNTILSGTP